MGPVASVPTIVESTVVGIVGEVEGPLSRRSNKPTSPCPCTAMGQWVLLADEPIDWEVRQPAKDKGTSKSSMLDRGTSIVGLEIPILIRVHAANLRIDARVSYKAIHRRRVNATKAWIRRLTQEIHFHVKPLEMPNIAKVTQFELKTDDVLTLLSVYTV